jgi:hypothetical protein
MRSLDASRLVRQYVWILGAGLLLEGAALIVVDRLGLPVGTLASDTPHNVLHIVWGLVLLGVVSTGRGARRVAWAAVVFGVFYIALGILGVIVDRPFGLLLSPSVNAFHFTVGPLALVLGLWALRSGSPSTSATVV